MASHLWSTEDELFQLCKTELFTAVVGDVLDQQGYTHQFLHPQIKPLATDMTVVGKAMPVLEADVFAAEQNHVIDSELQKPFGLMFRALDDLQKNEVYICAGSSPRYALWGGLMSVRAIKCGASGAVMDGYSRDTNDILGLGFPTFSYGSYAQDQGVRGKVIDFRVPIEINQVTIRNGDIVFGDRDGVLVVPQEIVEETFTLALEKARKEKLVLKALQNGMTSEEAFAKYGVM